MLNNFGKMITKSTKATRLLLLACIVLESCLALPIELNSFDEYTQIPDSYVFFPSEKGVELFTLPWFRKHGAEYFSSGKSKTRPLNKLIDDSELSSVSENQTQSLKNPKIAEQLTEIKLPEITSFQPPKYQETRFIELEETLPSVFEDHPESLKNPGEFVDDKYEIVPKPEEKSPSISPDYPEWPMNPEIAGQLTEIKPEITSFQPPEYQEIVLELEEKLPSVFEDHPESPKNPEELTKLQKTPLTTSTTVPKPLDFSIPAFDIIHDDDDKLHHESPPSVQQAHEHQDMTLIKPEEELSSISEEDRNDHSCSKGQEVSPATTEHTTLTTEIIDATAKMFSTSKFLKMDEYEKRDFIIDCMKENITFFRDVKQIMFSTFTEDQMYEDFIGTDRALLTKNYYKLGIIGIIYSHNMYNCRDKLKVELHHDLH